MLILTTKIFFFETFFRLVFVVKSLKLHFQFGSKPGKAGALGLGAVKSKAENFSRGFPAFSCCVVVSVLI